MWGKLVLSAECIHKSNVKYLMAGQWPLGVVYYYNIIWFNYYYWMYKQHVTDVLCKVKYCLAVYFYLTYFTTVGVPLEHFSLWLHFIVKQMLVQTPLFGSISMCRLWHGLHKFVWSVDSHYPSKIWQSSTELLVMYHSSSASMNVRWGRGQETVETKSGPPWSAPVFK